MDRFFNMDNKFFSAMSRVADLLLLTILCIVCCIPVITITDSISAMYYVTLKMIRNEESYIARGFFHSFRQNFKQSIPITLIMVVAGVLLVFDLNVARSMEGMMGTAFKVVFYMLAFLYLMIFIYINPLLAKFDNTVRNTFSNALLMSIRHLPYTFAMIFITLVPFAIPFVPQQRISGILLMLFIILGPGTLAFCKSWFLVRIFDNYIPPEEPEGSSGNELPELQEDSHDSLER